MKMPCLYLVLEFVDGLPLSSYLEQHALLPVSVLTIAIQLCEGLEHAHQNGIVHRDVKPGNIMIQTGGELHARILDFGIARLSDQSGQQLTRTNGLVGSLAYLSPEQCKGEVATPLSDQYALGCVLYECLAGAPPLVAASDMEMLQAHVDKHPPRLVARPAEPLPVGLEAIIFRMMSKDPSRRFPTMGHLRSALELCQSGRGEEITDQLSLASPSTSTSKMRRGIVACVIVSALIGVAFAVMVRGRSAPTMEDSFCDSTNQSHSLEGWNPAVQKIPVCDQGRFARAWIDRHVHTSNYGAMMRAYGTLICDMQSNVTPALLDEAANYFANHARTMSGERSQDLRLQNANILQQLGRFSDAEKQLQQVLSVNPKMATTVFAIQLSDLQRKQGRLGEALETLERVKKFESLKMKDHWLLHRVTLALQLGDGAGARDYLHQMSTPASVLCVSLATSFAQHGDMATALQCYRRSRTVETRTVEPRTQAEQDLLFQLAVYCLRNNLRKEQKEIVQDAMRFPASSSHSFEGLIRMLVCDGLSDEASGLLNQVEAREGRTPRTLVLRGICFRLRNQLEDAKVQFEAARQLAKSRHEDIILYDLYLVDTGSIIRNSSRVLDQLTDILNHGTITDPDVSQAVFELTLHLVHTLSQEKRSSEIDKLCDLYVSTQGSAKPDARLANLFDARAAAAADLGAKHAAGKFVEQAIDFAADYDKPFFLCHKAVLTEELGDRHSAIRIFRDAFDRRACLNLAGYADNFAHCLFREVMDLCKRGEYTNSMETMKESLGLLVRWRPERTRDICRSHFILCAIYMQLGDTKHASASYREAMKYLGGNGAKNKFLTKLEFDAYSKLLGGELRLYRLSVCTPENLRRALISVGDESFLGGLYLPCKFAYDLANQPMCAQPKQKDASPERVLQLRLELLAVWRQQESCALIDLKKLNLLSEPEQLLYLQKLAKISFREKVNVFSAVHTRLVALLQRNRSLDLQIINSYIEFLNSMKETQLALEVVEVRNRGK